MNTRPYPVLCTCAVWPWVSHDQKHEQLPTKPTQKPWIRTTGVPIFPLSRALVYDVDFKCMCSDDEEDTSDEPRDVIHSTDTSPEAMERRAEIVRELLDVQTSIARSLLMQVQPSLAGNKKQRKRRKQVHMLQLHMNVHESSRCSHVQSPLRTHILSLTYCVLCADEPQAPRCCGCE